MFIVSPITLNYMSTPIQTECILLKHIGNVKTLNNPNTQYNAGYVTGQKASYGIDFTSWKCPSHDKDFCAG